jgi:hypothetical protein
MIIIASLRKTLSMHILKLNIPNMQENIMPTPEAPISNFGIIALVASSSVIAAMVTQFVGWARDAFKAKKNHDFAKVYLIAALQRYANEASNAISDSENYDSSDGEVGRPVGNVPELDAYPDTVDWHSLGAKTTQEMLAFQVDIEAIRAAIAFEWEVVGDEDFVIPNVRKKTALAGLRALQLVAKLESEYTGETIDLGNEDWWVKSALSSARDKYMVRRKLDETLTEALTP